VHESFRWTIDELKEAIRMSEEVREIRDAEEGQGEQPVRIIL